MGILDRHYDRQPRPFYERRKLKPTRERPGKRQSPESDLGRLARGEAVPIQRKKWWQFWR